MSARATEIGRLYKGRLEVLSPLHVGSGEFDEREGVRGKSGTGSNDSPQVALIVRDGEGKPYIPGTTIKGLLRRLLEGEDEITLVAGSIKQEKGGQIGSVQVRGARLVKPGDTRHLPFSEALKVSQVGEGVFVAARTAINDATGSVDDGKLFFQEMVAPKTCFDIELMVAPRSFAETEAVSEALNKALAQLTQKDGAQIGKGQADGFGRIRLDPQTLTASTGLLDPATGAVSWSAPRRVELTKATVRSTPAFTVAFSCPGPFIIADASRGKEHKPGESKEDRKKGEAHSRPQKLGADLPLILGSSVSGALRARAEWLAAVLNLAMPDEKGLIADARHLPKDPVNRLFGVTGFRGLLSIRGMDVSTAKLWEVTSVQLDRFSGAPVDNALFTTEVFIGARFSITFDIEARGKPDPALPWRQRLDAASVRLLDALIDDLRTNGLQIGAGGNKGFGWFDADVVEGGQNG